MTLALEGKSKVGHECSESCDGHHAVTGLLLGFKSLNMSRYHGDEGVGYHNRHNELLEYAVRDTLCWSVCRLRYILLKVFRLRYTFRDNQ